VPEQTFPAPERRSGIVSHYKTGIHGAATDQPSVTLQERRPLAVFHLAIRDGADGVVKKAGKAFGLDLPTTASTSVSMGGRTALAIAPNTWLLTNNNVAHEADSGAQADELAAAVGDGGAVNDVSQGRCVLRVDGPNSRDVLGKLSPLDVHPSAFGADACATTQMAHVAVTYRRVGDGNAFDLFVSRGFSQHFWEALTHAAGEYGYQVLDAGL